MCIPTFICDVFPKGGFFLIISKRIQKLVLGVTLSTVIISGAYFSMYSLDEPNIEPTHTQAFLEENLTQLPQIPYRTVVAQTLTSDLTKAIPTLFASQSQTPVDTSLDSIAKEATQTSKLDEVIELEKEKVETILLEEVLAPKLINEITGSEGLQLLVSYVGEPEKIAYDTRLDDTTKYLQVKLALHNTNTKTLEYSPYNFYLQDENGETYDYTYNMVAPNVLLYGGTLISSGTALGTINFEVPKDANIKYLYYTHAAYNIHMAVDVTQTTSTPESIVREKVTTSLAPSDNLPSIVKGSKITINKSEVIQGSSTAVPRDDYEFVKVNVTVTNVGIEPCEYNSFNFKLLDSYGNMEGSIYNYLIGDNAMRIGSLLPNESYTGDILFERPIGDSSMLVYQPDIFDKQSLALILLP